MHDEESESLALVFLEQFWADQGSGQTRSLEEYLGLFPGNEETIAREYLSALTDARGGDDTVTENVSRHDRIGHYQLRKELGRGGQGVVWLAEDTRLGRKVALKVLTGLGPGAEAHLARFKREAALASKLDHPGICAVHDTGIESGVPFIAMRLVDGESLAERLGRFRSQAMEDEIATFLSFDGDDDEEVPEPTSGSASDSASSSIDRAELDRVITVFEKAALALHAAHEAGIVHRDIKPGNIMLTKDDDPVILDFGLAHDDGDDAGPSLTQTGDLFGTPAYMSPEQITGRRVRVDRRSDIYSLAVTLYECITTKRPFEEPTRESLYQAILSKEAVPARRINRRIPTDLEVVLQCAMDKDRDKRYQTAADMAEDLRRIRESEPIVARPVGPLGRTLRWAKRRPATASLLGTVFLALSAIAIITAINNRDLERLNTDLEASTKVAEANEEQARRNANEARANERRAKAETAAKEVALRDKDEALGREQAALAERTTALSEYQRLADTRLLSNARTAADGLWPAHPDLVSDLVAWQAKYAPLIARLDGHRNALAALGKYARPYTEEERRSDFAVELTRIAKLEYDLPRFREQLPTARDEEQRRQGEAFIAKLEGELDALREAVKGRRSWDFGENVDLQFRHEILAALVSNLAAFTDENGGVTASIAGRLDRSRRIRKETLEDHSTLWSQTTARIASNPRYNGLSLAPQLGLIPLGPDPTSGLEEFLDWRTHDWSENEGELPVRDKGGSIGMTETRGLIFVLIPGGSFWMGAQRDPKKPNFDPEARREEFPVREVVLAPYLISKYEMTQGQWSRFDGKNPSEYGRGFRAKHMRATVDLRHPVERLSWNDASLRLDRLGLLLPTEAQWERAARADASPATRWAGTSDVAELARFANINGAETQVIGFFVKNEPSHEDDWIIHAPVGSFAANAFGLFDMTGNVAEWCRDGFTNYTDKPAHGDGLRPGESRYRTNRGGAFSGTAADARLSSRKEDFPGIRGNAVGLRPSRSITTE